jgi:hypothetical protein
VVDHHQARSRSQNQSRAFQNVTASCVHSGQRFPGDKPVRVLWGNPLAFLWADHYTGVQMEGLGGGENGQLFPFPWRFVAFHNPIHAQAPSLFRVLARYGSLGVQHVGGDDYE